VELAAKPLAPRSPAALAADLVVAGTLAFWALVPLVRARAEIGVAELATLLLALFVAALFVLRSPERAVPVPLVLQALPSLAAAALLPALAAPIGSWSTAAEIGFVCGAALALVSFASLGRSFAVLPADRGVVERGPYRWLRHPAYLGELAMCLAAASSSWRALPLFGLVLGTTVLRIRAEERGLGAAYEAYRARVRWALVPGVW